MSVLGRTRGQILSADLQSLADELLLDVGALRTIGKLLDDKRQVIFQGPPGTGKTYVARKLAERLAGSADRVRLVQFHPSYAYEDFVQGFRPALQGGQPGFALRNGPLLDAAKDAREEPDAKHFLVIDEINRGNLGKVFGELYFLLEYRGEQMRLQYADAGERFALPGNLYLIGTMNTADRSIALVDLALRRRFHFVEFHPDKPPVRGLLRRWLDEYAPDMAWVAEVVDRANEKLDDRQAAIGPSYFMKPDLGKEMVDLIWEHNVLPYVEERFYGEHDRLDEFRLDKLLGDVKPDGDGEQPDESLRKRLDTPVTALKLSSESMTTRVKNCLSTENIRTIEDLTRKTTEEIDTIPGLGLDSRKEIEAWLSERHLQLGTDYRAVRPHLTNDDNDDNAMRLDLQEYVRSDPVRLFAAQRDELGDILTSLTIEPVSGVEGAYHLTPGSTVGALDIGDLSVSIRPKLDISRVLFLASYAMGAFDLREERFDFQDAPTLVEALASALVAAARRAFARGLLHGYRTEEEALHTVRGRIRIDDQLRRRFGVAVPVEVRYDEFTEDITANRLVKAAAARLGRMRLRSPRSREGLRWVGARLENVSLARSPPCLRSRSIG